MPLRHAMEVRHPSFMMTEYLALARRHEVATVFADSDEYPSFADVTGDFVYARLMRTRAGVRHRLSGTAHRAGPTRRGHGLQAANPPACRASSRRQRRRAARDVFMYFISGAKERAPAAAIATLAALGLRRRRTDRARPAGA